jgi:hypothetical protein
LHLDELEEDYLLAFSGARFWHGIGFTVTRFRR